MISVVIPTRNRADLLTAALESLLAQSLDPAHFEVLVIDNGSTDRTNGLVEAFRQRLPNLRYLYAPEPGLHTGRHRGMQESTGDVLVFADDDIVAQPGWLESIREIYSDPEVAMSGGNNLPLYLEPPPDWLKRMWDESSLGGGRALPALSLLELPGPPRPGDPNLVWGCNFAIRRRVLEAAGGFHPDAMPRELIRFRGDGESHVSRYVAERGLRCVFHPGASVYHSVTPDRMTFAYFRERGFNQGVSDSYTALRHRLIAGTHEPGAGRLMRGTQSVLRKLKARLRTLAETSRPTREAILGHAEGYAYHQRLFYTDREVQAWVLKDSYL